MNLGRLLWTVIGLVAATALVSSGINRKWGTEASDVALESVPPYVVSNIEARLFFHDRDTLSDDILAKSDLILWNTDIGRGQAGGPSIATMVIVEITGEAGAFDKNRRVALRVTSRGRKLFEHSVRTMVMSPAGKFYAAFWLYDTACDPVDLIAFVTGQTVESRKTAAIKFACGE